MKKRPARIPVLRAGIFGGAVFTVLLATACKQAPRQQAPSSADQPSSLDRGLIAHWSFDSNSNPKADVSGNGHDGRAEGSLSIVPGKVGNALDLSSGDSFIRVTANPDVFRFGPDDAWSIAGWIKMSEIGNGWQGIVTKSRDQDHWLGMWISQDGEWHTGGGAGINIGTVSPNQWYHWVLVQEPNKDAGAKIRLYVNGKLLQMADGYRQRCGPGDLLLGKARTPEGDEIFKGLIDEIRIYHRMLTESEIQSLANGE
jgi:hypothetical protein